MERGREQGREIYLREFEVHGRSQFHALRPRVGGGGAKHRTDFKYLICFTGPGEERSENIYFIKRRRERERRKEIEEKKGI